jgi:hypothetical protein
MSQQINLFNPAFLKQKRYFSVRTMLQALGLILLGAASLYGYAIYQHKLLAKQVEEMSRRYAAEQLRLAVFSREFSPEKSSQRLQEELQKIESESLAQQEILDTLKSGVIGNTDGYSEYLRAFARQTVHGLWLTGFQIEGDGVRMSLNGAALSPKLVPAYIQRLSKEKVMRGKTFASLQIQLPKTVPSQQTDNHYVEFSMQSEESRGDAK